VGRILALDYGRRRIGLAMSDPLQCIAQSFDTWQNTSIEHIIQRLSSLILSYQIELLVVGLPITLKGEHKKLAKDVEHFCHQIRKRINMPVVLWDERLTSVQAKKIMISMNEKPSRQKEKVDRMAATLILQNYLDANARPSIP